MSDKHTQRGRLAHLTRLKSVLSITSRALTGIFIASVIIIALLTIPITSLAYSLDPRLAVAPVIVCLLLCCYVFSKERQLQDVIETTQSVGSSFIQSTVRKIVENSIENTFETFILFPVGVAILGVILISLGHTYVGTSFIGVAVLALSFLTCCCCASKFLASKLLDSYLGTEGQSSENIPLLV